MNVSGLIFHHRYNFTGIQAISPLSAHEHSERSIHYGPSEVVHIEDFDGGKYILGKYDKWVSCNSVNKSLFFFWRFGNQPTGFENDLTKAIDYTWGSSYMNYRAYGIINDSIVNKVEVTLSNGQTFTETVFYEDLFLFTWKSDKSGDWYLQSIRGYDSDNNIIYEEEI